MSTWSSWHETDAEQYGPWRAASNGEPVGSVLGGACPVCGVGTLYRWYALEDDDARVLGGARYLGHGRLWEWCSACRTFERFRDSFAPFRRGARTAPLRSGTVEQAWVAAS